MEADVFEPVCIHKLAHMAIQEHRYRASVNVTVLTFLDKDVLNLSSQVRLSLLQILAVCQVLAHELLCRR